MFQSSSAPTTYKITLPQASTWTGQIDYTTTGSGTGCTVWITNPYQYTTYWDITIGTDASGPFSIPPSIWPTKPCGVTFNWNEGKGEFDCEGCSHSQKRHVRNHHGEEDHCRDCKNPPPKNILPDGKEDGTT